MRSLKELQEQLAEETFGISREKAWQQGICVSCHKRVADDAGHYDGDLIYSQAGEREYRISGLCERCFDQITGGDDE